MLGNIICWIVAISLILTNSNMSDKFYIRLLFAMGFIVLGSINKAVDMYYDTHRTKNNNMDETNITT